MKSNGRKVISEKETSETETMEKQDVAIQKEWRWFLIRLLILIGILYLLFGVMFGITTVKNEDMSPRMSAGDLVLYYRLDKHPVAGDVIVYKKRSAVRGTNCRERGRFGRNYRTGNSEGQRECRTGTKYFLSDSAIRK